MTQPTILRHQLDNGLRIVLVPDERVPVVGVCLVYKVGSAHEPAGRSGFAHLFEHMMFEGSANIGKTQHFQYVESAGGRINAYTSWDSTVYIDTLPSHELELGLWLEADRMATLAQALSQESLDNQRDVVKNERRLKIDNVPYGRSEERLFELIYPETHPYHHSTFGSMEDLSAASLEDVRAFFETYYVPNNAVLTLVGDVEADPALDLVERHFGPIPRGSEPPPMPGTDRARLDGPAREEVGDEVPLPRFFIGCPIPPLGSDGFDVADLTADLLISGRASRLEKRLVRELRLAQAVDAFTYPLVSGSALFLVDVTAAEDVANADVEAALINELDRLADEPPSEEEMARVRLRRATDHAVRMQESDERADRIGMYACLLNEPERYGRERQRDDAIGPDAVREFARDALSAENRVSLWYLPAE
jgi:zinc protease